MLNLKLNRALIFTKNRQIFLAVFLCFLSFKCCLASELPHPKSLSFEERDLKIKSFISTKIPLNNSQLKDTSTTKEIFHEFSFYEMGTKFIIRYFHDNELNISELDSILKARIQQLNLIFSDYREDSEISKVTKIVGIQKLNKEVFEVLFESEVAFKETNHNFDVTVGSLTKLWRRMKRQNKLQSRNDIENATKFVNFDLLNFNRKDATINLKTDKVQLDFGGIVKGFALDELKKIFEKNNINSFFLEAGGNISLGNHPQNGWLISINKRDMNLKNMAISTSGDFFQKVEIEGKTYSHILKKDGKSFKNKQNQITVFGKSGVVTDWISTSYFLVSNKKFKKIASKQKVTFQTYQAE